ncbi:MAG: tetratricopeptide repeat protein [Gammaproteobacteria bacterium]|nr:tetratricopeptide repeat protein [Gammaproteobacteria bacterium]MDH3446544.1 tetratricopeptide repeat protein [Gammaproteobacteria bacterium]
MRSVRHNFRFALIAACLLSAGCASLQQATSGGRSLLGQQQTQVNPVKSQQDAVADATYELLVAEIALNQGDTELAIKHYLALARSQDNPEIAERAVRVAVYGQDLEAAVQSAQRWIELDPDRVEARQVIAAIYVRQDKIQEAFDYIDGMIRTTDLDDADLFPPLLGILAREKNANTVLAVSQRIAYEYPERAYAQYLHGMLAAQNGRSEEALRFLNRSIEIAEIEGVHSARAKVLLRLGRPDEAVVSLQKAVEGNPDDQSLRLTYARLLVDVKEYEKARVEFEKLHQASPNDAELLYTLGLLSLESQRLDDAEKYMMMLVRLNQREGEAQYYLGRINENRKDYEAAIDWYRQVHVGEYKFDARLRIADMLGNLERTDEAIEHLDAMLRGSQSNGSLVRIYITKGELLRSARRYQQAMDVFDTALGIVPGNSDLLYARALVAEKLGRIDQLEADIKTILKTEPDNAHALNALGFTLADQTERYQEAYDYLKRAIEIMPDDPAIIDSWGWVHYRLGDYETAISLLRKALSRFDDAEIAAHLGEVLWASGQQQEAREIWQKALKKSPDDPMLQEVMQRFIP